MTATAGLRRLATFVLVALIGLAPARAHAQAGATNAAAAEALFEDAVKLMEKQDYATACEKFRASQGLDPALGTQLRLADCFDRLGKTASAWATFKEVASLAAVRNQAERQRLAEERATELEARLARLEIRVAPKHAPEGLEIKLNGTGVPAASWNSGLPVDPGVQKIEASAPGKRPWTGSIDVPVGPTEVTFAVPALASAAKTTKRDKGASGDAGSSGSTQRTIGYITGGVGLAGLVASGILAYRANQLRNDSLDHCGASDPNGCTPRGTDLRDDALSYARAANYPFFAGAALLAGGIALVLTAPSGTSEPSGPRLTASVFPWPRQASVGMKGSW